MVGWRGGRVVEWKGGGRLSSPQLLKQRICVICLSLTLLTRSNSIQFSRWLNPLDHPLFHTPHSVYENMQVGCSNKQTLSWTRLCSSRFLSFPCSDFCFVLITFLQNRQIKWILHFNSSSHYPRKIHRPGTLFPLKPSHDFSGYTSQADRASLSSTISVRLELWEASSQFSVKNFITYYRITKG